MGVAQGFDAAGKLEDLDLGGAVGPVVMPADDYVAAGQRMAVVAKIPALKFKFDVHALPALRPDLPFRLAIGEAGPSGCLKNKKSGRNLPLSRRTFLPQQYNRTLTFRRANPWSAGALLPLSRCQTLLFNDRTKQLCSITPQTSGKTAALQDIRP